MFRTFLFALLVVFIGCGPDDAELIENISSTPLFPIESGKTNDYQVQELIYRQEGRIIDTIVYQLRESIADSYVDETGADVFLMDRYVRTDPLGEWEFDENWTVKICNNELLVTENSLPFVKLALPIEKNKTWSAIKYFEPNKIVTIGGEDIDYFKNWESKVTETNGKWGEQTQVTTVVLADFENRLQRRYAIEKYADNLGLIYREILAVDTQCFDNCQNKSWTEKAEKGHYYLQTLIK